MSANGSGIYEGRD